jgi:hypothetical protein
MKLYLIIHDCTGMARATVDFRSNVPAWWCVTQVFHHDTERGEHLSEE